MELTIALVISIISVVITVSNFVLGRKDKSNKDVENESYKWGTIDQQIKQIIAKLDKIDDKLDNYDKEIEEKVEKAIKQHEKLYHSKG